MDKQTEDRLQGEEIRPGQWSKGEDAVLTHLLLVYLLSLNLRLPSQGHKGQTTGRLGRPDLSSGNPGGSARLLERCTEENIKIKIVLPTAALYICLLPKPGASLPSSVSPSKLELSSPPFADEKPEAQRGCATQPGAHFSNTLGSRF